MLVDRVLSDLDLPDAEDMTGNALRGSNLGRCARQLAYRMFKDAYPPEPLPARARLVFRFGDMIHELIRAEFRRVLPGEWGAEEARFHFKVPLSIKEAGRAQLMFEAGTLVGHVWGDAQLRRYVGPQGPEGGQPSETFEHRRGLWLDLAEPALYVPLHVDGIADLKLLGREGLASVEIKSMASGSFLRAVKGHVDYAYRVQMAAALEATGLDTEVYVTLRKDTCHLLEVVYDKAATEVAVTFTKQSKTIQALGLPLGAVEWEAAEVRHPFEPHLLEQARARVKRVLRATVTNLPEREYGPDFTCATCQGTGTQTLAKNTGNPLKNGPKPCGDCERADVPVETPLGAVSIVGGVGAPSGQMARAELPFQCRYCAWVKHCWPIATLEIQDERPHWWIERETYEASGMTYRRPE